MGTYRYLHTNGRKSRVALVIPSNVDLIAGSATKKTSCRLGVGWNCRVWIVVGVLVTRRVGRGRASDVNGVRTNAGLARPIRPCWRYRMSLTCVMYTGAELLIPVSRPVGVLG